jgi:hypothetical protein
METGLTRNQIISVLTKSPHGDLAEYVPVGVRAAKEDPDFYAHLIAWNERKGAIRDAKVALPVLALTAPGTFADEELRDNALAHIVKLDPRNLVRSVRFSKGQPIKERRRLSRVVEMYLREREDSRSKFDRVAMQHKASLKELYALLHIKPGNHAQKVLFAGEKIGVFGDIAKLKDMNPAEAAGTIIGKRIPFLVAMGALGAKAKEPDVVQALITAMSPAEVVTNAKMLERLGVKTNPALRASFEAALKRAAESGRTGATLKATQAAQAVGGAVGEKLRGLQEKQIDKIQVDGDWLVLADKSGSMGHSIETARHVSAILARVAKGKVHLVFFDTVPQYIDVTGLELDAISGITKRVVANGGTSPGAGLRYAHEKGLIVDGIAIVGDGNENNAPVFASVYKDFCAMAGKDVPLYVYLLKGDPPTMVSNNARSGIEMQVFDLLGGVDYYSLPNLVQTMRTNRYGLADEIMGVPLLRLGDVFKTAAKESEIA